MKQFKCAILLFIFLFTGKTSAQNSRINFPPPSTENLAPQVDFSWINFCLGDTTCFINQTIRGNTYTWTISQISLVGHPHIDTIYKSTDTNICFYFPAAGTYTVGLHAYNNHDVTVTKVITVGTITDAAFSFIHCSNGFVNNSTCAKTFYWDFGDGNHSTLAVPTHQYADTGHYNVQLIVYDGGVSDTMTKIVFVDVISFVNPAFTATVSFDTVHVNAVFAGAGTQYYWTWNDGSPFSTGKDSVHVYKDSTSTFIIELFAVNVCGPASSLDTVRLTQTGPPPIVDFSWANLCPGDTTCFYNQSYGAATYTWTISETVNNPTPSKVVLYSSNNPNICFPFPGTGTYSVTLAGKNIITTFTEKTIVLGNNTLANFSFIPCSNMFSNLSQCATSSYWNFGDGNLSNLTSPVHVYRDTGNYLVTLVVTQGPVNDTLRKNVHVPGLEYISGQFTATSSWDSAFVHSDYPGNDGKYYWTWGDGTHASGHDTLHFYKDSTAKYVIQLKATNACGSAVYSDTLQITIPKPPPGLNFSQSSVSIVPNPVTNGSYVDIYFSAFAADIYLVQIYNDIGQVVFEQNFNFGSGINEFKVNSLGWAPAIYVIVLQSGNSFVRNKFQIENSN